MKFGYVRMRYSIDNASELELNLYKILIEAFPETCQKPKMDHISKIVIGWKLFSIFAESSILDVWRVSDLLFKSTVLI